jgi:hypothetical protein
MLITAPLSLAKKFTVISLSTESPLLALSGRLCHVVGVQSR